MQQEADRIIVLREDTSRLLSRIDLDTVQALLRLAGEPSWASAVAKATRAPGLAIATSIREPAFSELVLFGPPGVVETILATPHRGEPARCVDAVSLALGLSDAPLEIVKLTSTSAQLKYIDRALPAGTATVWSDLLSDFTEHPIRLAAPAPRLS